MPQVSFEDALAPNTVSFEEGLGEAPEGTVKDTLVGTGVKGIPGAVLGAPRFLLSDLPDAAVSAATGTNAKWEANPANYLPSSEDVNKGVYGGVNAIRGMVGLKPMVPYEPETFAGRALQSTISNAPAAALDAPAGIMSMLRSVGKIGAATTAGEAAHEAVPDSPLAPLLAAVVAHSALGYAGRGYGAVKSALQPDLNPEESGRSFAGAPAVAVAGDPNVIRPTGAADEATAQTYLNRAVAGPGTGAPPTPAMAGLQAFLQHLGETRRAERETAAAPAYNAFRGEPPMVLPGPDQKYTIGDNVKPTRAEAAPLASMPDLNSAMNRAARNIVGDTGGARAANNPYGGPYAKTTVLDFDAGGNTIHRTGEALTPDLLDRTKRQLDIKANQALNNTGTGRDADTASSRTNQAQQLSAFLERQYPDTYPNALATWRQGSAPLNALDHPEITAVTGVNPLTGMETNKGAMYPSQMLDHITQAPEVVDRFAQGVRDAGGSEADALRPIRDAIVGSIREKKGVIDPITGDINGRDLAEAARPYMPVLRQRFPALASQFEDARSAQATLESVQREKALADSIRKGDWRDSNGVVTPRKLKSWIDSNEREITAAHGASAVMRLRQLQEALPKNPGESLTRTLVGGAAKLIPVGLGDYLGGPIGAIAGLAGKEAGSDVAAGRAREFNDAYSTAIEQLGMDPVAANRLGRSFAGKPPAGRLNALMRAIQPVLDAAKVAPLTGRAGASK